MTTDYLPDSLASALGRVVAEERRKWQGDHQRELDLLRARMDGMEADRRRREAEWEADVERRVDAKVEARLAEIRDGRDGRDADDESIFNRISERLDEKLAAIPVPTAGKDGRDGIDGKDGLGISDAIKDVRGHLLLVMANGQTKDIGQVDGQPGVKGDPGEKGEPGAPGQDAYPGEARGLFDPEASYRKNDTVSLHGSEWRAKKDSPGECPGEGWMLSAQRGKRGEKGDPGERGETGSTVEMNGTTLIVTRGDGTISAHDLEDLLKGK